MDEQFIAKVEVHSEKIKNLEDFKEGQEKKNETIENKLDGVDKNFTVHLTKFQYIERIVIGAVALGLVALGNQLLGLIQK